MSFGSCLQSAATYLHLAGSPIACKRHQADYPSEEPARKRRKHNPPFVTRLSLQTLHKRLRHRDKTCKTSYGAHFTNCAPLYSKSEVSVTNCQDQFAPPQNLGQTSTPRSFAPLPKFGQTSTPTSLPYQYTPVQPAPRAQTVPRHYELPHLQQHSRHQQHPQQARPAQAPQSAQPTQSDSQPLQSPQPASVPRFSQAPRTAQAPQPAQPTQSAQYARPTQPAPAAQPANPVKPLQTPRPSQPSQTTQSAQPAQSNPTPTPYSSHLPDQPFCGKCGRVIGANEKLRDHKWKHVTITVKERGLYDILDIFPSATGADIRRAYKKQALQHHPDKNIHQPQVAHEKFKAVKQAYDILLDEKQRAVYNKHGLDYCLNGPPRDPPPKPAQTKQPPRPNPRPAPGSQPRQPPRPSPQAVDCLGCHRTFARHFSMLDHLGNGHCRRTKGLDADYILGRFYEGLVGGWRDSNGRITCPGCAKSHYVISDLFQHMALNTTCIEARNFRAGCGYAWELFRWVEQSLHSH